MSRILCGNEDMHVEFRVRTFIELFSKQELYFHDDFIKSLISLSEYNKHLLDSSFDTSATAKGKSKEERQKAGFEDGIASTIKPNDYSSMWYIMALANVTSLQINFVYPETNGSLIDRSYMNVSIRPQKVYHPDAVYVMWSYTQNTNFHGWSPNHFVPLIPVNAPQVSKKRECATPNTASNSFPEPQSQSQKRSSDKQSAENVKRAKKYLTHFSPKWTKEWPCIVASSKSDHEFHCTVCKRTVSCAK